MKKISIIMAALSIVLTQCKKPVVEKPEVKEDIFISFSAGVGINKADIDLNSGSITWNNGDKVYVLHDGKLLSGNLTAKDVNGVRATVSGTVTGVIEESKKFYFLYVGSGVEVSTSLADEGKISLDIESQTDNPEDVGEYMIGGTAGVDLHLVESKYVPVTPGYIPFTPITAVIRVNAGELTGGNIEFCGDNAYNATQISVVDGKLTPVSTKGTINFTASTNAAVSVLPTGTTEGDFETFGFYQTPKLGVVGIKNGIKSGRIYMEVVGGKPKPIEIRFEDFAVTTTEVQGVHSTCASTGGRTSGSEFDYEGVCWGTSHNPVVDNNTNVYYFNQLGPDGKYIKKDGQSPTFTAFVDGLSPSSTYYVRAFVKKAGMLIYGDEKTIPTTASENVEYVDIGTEVLWAKWNLGATGDYDAGDYYMWGDLACCTGVGDNYPNPDYWRNYKFANTDCNGGDDVVNNNKFVKYCNDVNFWYNPKGTPDGKTVLDDEDDVVKRTLNDGSRMPTYQDWADMYAQINSTTIVGSGSNRTLKCTYKNGAVLYFPAAGYRYADGFKSNDYNGSDGSFFMMWLNALDSPVSGHYCRIKAKNGNTWVDQSGAGNWRSDGLNIRPVKDATTVVAPGFN